MEFNKLLEENWEWLLAAAAVTFGILVNLIWRRKQRKILKGLQQIIEEEKNITGGDKFKTPRDVEEALKTVFKTRQQEMERMRMMETYRRDYIGNVAHELKTPIFTIQGYLDSAADELEVEKPDMPTIISFLNKAQKNTGRLGQIINDLDTITKYESGFLQLEYEAFDLQELVRDVIESLEIQAAEKQIHIYDHAMDSGYMVWADRFRIRQVLINLGYNSIKYGKPGGYTKIRISRAGNKVIVEVADNGIGIPAEHLNRIFERFYRVEKSRSRASGGSGLGLSICKHIIEAHGETISVLSTEGAGSVFSFGLKAYESDSNG
ncbi:MAG: sensor histidine kinase [Bacteroidetes bacterium]|nr:sensor histidine kinase [Bacteroidota bacterium]